MVPSKDFFNLTSTSRPKSTPSHLCCRALFHKRPFLLELWPQRTWPITPPTPLPHRTPSPPAELMPTFSPFFLNPHPIIHSDHNSFLCIFKLVHLGLGCFIGPQLTNKMKWVLPPRICSYRLRLIFQYLHLKKKFFFTTIPVLYLFFMDAFDTVTFFNCYKLAKEGIKNMRLYYLWSKYLGKEITRMFLT